MSTNLRLFDEHSEYEEWVSGPDAVIPRVSYCKDNHDVHYNPLNNNRIIRYTASEKLTEVGTTGSGLHVNSFNTSIKTHTFYNGNGKITFNDDVTNIGSSAFSGCSDLTSIVIPNTVTTIGNLAFDGCVNLTNANMPYTITSIGDYAFRSCFNLVNVSFPNTLVSIGNWTFSNCDSLVSINIPNSVTTIGNNAFYACDALTTMHIGSGVTSIGNAALNSNQNLTNITVDENNTTYDSRNNCNAIIETSTNILVVGCKNTTIPNDIVTIGDNAFNNCIGLTSIGNVGSGAFLEIPNNVTTIAPHAFQGCDGLTTVTISDNITTIGNSAFESCSYLSTVTIGNGVTSIGERCFYSCNRLTQIHIGTNIGTIGSQVFAQIDSFTIEATTPPTIQVNTFYSGGINKLYVPAGSISLYQSSNWPVDNSDILPIPTS